ncbi:unnamed protein product, partial [Prorocentrum cordatum]
DRLRRARRPGSPPDFRWLRQGCCVDAGAPGGGGGCAAPARWLGTPSTWEPDSGAESLRWPDDSGASGCGVSRLEIQAFGHAPESEPLQPQALRRCRSSPAVASAGCTGSAPRAASRCIGPHGPPPHASPAGAAREPSALGALAGISPRRAAPSWATRPAGGEPDAAQIRRPRCLGPSGPFNVRVVALLPHRRGGPWRAPPRSPRTLRGRGWRGQRGRRGGGRAA